jgi:hypothetical protein
LAAPPAGLSLCEFFAVARPLAEKGELALADEHDTDRSGRPLVERLALLLEYMFRGSCPHVESAVIRERKRRRMPPPFWAPHE